MGHVWKSEGNFLECVLPSPWEAILFLPFRLAGPLVSCLHLTLGLLEWWEHGFLRGFWGSDSGCVAPVPLLLLSEPSSHLLSIWKTLRPTRRISLTVACCFGFSSHLKNIASRCVLDLCVFGPQANAEPPRAEGSWYKDFLGLGCFGFGYIWKLPLGHRDVLKEKWQCDWASTDPPPGYWSVWVCP